MTFFLVETGILILVVLLFRHNFFHIINMTALRVLISSMAVPCPPMHYMKHIIYYLYVSYLLQVEGFKCHWFIMFGIRVCMCMCVCARVRERERE